jgi:hypothetical protein
MTQCPGWQQVCLADCTHPEGRCARLMLGPVKQGLVDRLRGQYRIGPHLPNGDPEFGWRQYQATPINIEAADEIVRLRKENGYLRAALGSSELPCVYCGLAADEMNKCIHGFPGCPRGDDILLGQ